MSPSPSSQGFLLTFKFLTSFSLVNLPRTQPNTSLFCKQPVSFPHDALLNCFPGRPPQQLTALFPVLGSLLSEAEARLEESPVCRMRKPDPHARVWLAGLDLPAPAGAAWSSGLPHPLGKSPRTGSWNWLWAAESMWTGSPSRESSQSAPRDEDRGGKRV